MQKFNAMKTRSANALFSFFMAVGNVLGYAAGSYGNLYKVVPFTKTEACDVYCANLKTCFFISIFLLIVLVTFALISVKEPKFVREIREADQDGGSVPFFKEIIGALKHLKKPMWVLMLVTRLNWIAWFPFLLYNTDGMGKEAYGGAVGDALFDKGVRAAEDYRKHAGHYQNPAPDVKAAALSLFAILGIPQAVRGLNDDKQHSSFYVQHTAPAYPPVPQWKILTVASIAAGIQFGWALQLSLLTPYSQLLGVPHTWSAFIWLCGPMSGLLVQPIVGYYSDRTTSKFGRRRPFIAAGTFLVAISVFLIGYAADFGRSLGDDLNKKTKPRAVGLFVVGFWILDVANNTMQGPCRALLADLSGGNPRKTRSANALFSFFMAVGNVLGYAAGSYGNLYKVVPFTKTEACDVYCANLKTCFFISIFLLIVLVTFALISVKEPKFVREIREADQDGGSVPFFKEILGALKHLKKPMWLLMLVTCLNWIAWFPFLLYNTDWMGKEVYGGAVGDALFDKGVRAGALGLMLNAVVLGVISLAIIYLARGFNNAKWLWGIANFVLCICLAMTVWVTKAAEDYRKHAGHHQNPSPGVKAAALSLFAILGIPQAVTFSIPFALASIFSDSSGAGQGLSLGILNLAIVIPQMLVSVVAGQLDAAFGGSNLPAFILGSVAAAASGICALTVLPTPESELPTSKALGSTSFPGH
ncbi:hypothetical protein RJ641_029318 [Dillenia turbinata]|uniref:Major facilitator superfamily (MFS) profile domain-containing protein n=1 Tax=Dillenia turbinata TaxID=194707 RepID=A0AAN8W1I6_9MAGN